MGFKKYDPNFKTKFAFHEEPDIVPFFQRYQSTCPHCHRNVEFPVELDGVNWEAAYHKLEEHFIFYMGRINEWIKLIGQTIDSEEGKKLHKKFTKEFLARHIQEARDTMEENND